MHEITLPKAGNTMEDGTVVRWHKAEGEKVAAGEVLLDVETDKATVEVESPAEGTLLKIVAPEGQTVPVLGLLAVVGESGEDISEVLAKAPASGTADGAQPSTPAAPAAKPAEAPSPSGDSAAGTPTQPSAGAGNVTPVVMPKAGNSMEEGTILAWRVAEGDTIAEGDIIMEVETDKANVEVEATDAGRLARIVAGEGDVVGVLEPVAYLADSDADLDAYLAANGGASAAAETKTPKTQGQPQPAPAAAQTPVEAPAAAGTGGRVKASPAARKLAEQRGVDLASLPAGRGPGGRILTDDVAAAPAAGAAAATGGAATPAVSPAPAQAASGEVTRQPMGKMRRAIAANLQASKQSIPHFYMRLTIDAAPLQDYYRLAKARFQLTLNDVIVAAVGRAMQAFPAFRQQIDGEDLVQRPASNIGIAVGTDKGLLVPVVVGTEGLALQQLGAETKRLVTAARAGKIENYGLGNLTISNLGMFGIEEFSAIINPPEACILAIGGIREEVIVSGGTMRPGRVMTLTGSFDHRIIDGLVAAKFFNRLKELLEYPAAME